ncbi:MAG: RES family NAD+ phosphorylase, partial [Acidimicrobiales bacterium]|nr:RES family NAD+ phosphorylase [Acidimicrobiales bacterium]MYK70750.1 RES family NAD+ phosphorylase [Acidimicrobiales bacterium]
CEPTSPHSKPALDIYRNVQGEPSPRIRTLAGSASGGRWGPRGEFEVLYLGRPTDSVVIEAYRHLVDVDLDGRLTAAMVGPRNLITCRVRLGRVLDLRDPAALCRAGLTTADLRTPVGDYDACQQVGRAAHQLGLDGIIAPAASSTGETLAVFTQHTRPTVSLEIETVERWENLPRDPRSGPA